MKILFLTRLFYPHKGGVEKHVLEVSKRLIKKGHEVTVVTENLDSDCFHDLNHENKDKSVMDGIEVIRINAGRDSFFKKFRVWKELWKYRKLIKEADVVHCHDVFFWYLPFKFIHPFKKVFTTFHGYETKFPVSKKAIIVRKISEKLSMGNICVGDFIKKWYGTVPDYVTYGGVEKYQISNIKYPILNKRKLKILFIGRLQEDTGIPIYLEALEELKKKKVDFQITFLGDGKYKKQASKYGKVMTQFNDVHHYTEFDFVFASSYLAILEALANKKIVFAAYKNDLKKDYLEMSPFSRLIIIESSPEKLAERIIYYIKNKNAKEKLEEQGLRFAKNQTWDKVVDSYLQLWKI